MAGHEERFRSQAYSFFNNPILQEVTKSPNSFNPSEGNAPNGLITLHHLKHSTPTTTLGTNLPGQETLGDLLKPHPNPIW